MVEESRFGLSVLWFLFNNMFFYRTHNVGSTVVQSIDGCTIMFINLILIIAYVFEIVLRFFTLFSLTDL